MAGGATSLAALRMQARAAPFLSPRHQRDAPIVIGVQRFSGLLHGVSRSHASLKRQSCLTVTILVRNAPLGTVVVRVMKMPASDAPVAAILAKFYLRDEMSAVTIDLRALLIILLSRL